MLEGCNVVPPSIAQGKEAPSSPRPRLCSIHQQTTASMNCEDSEIRTRPDVKTNTQYALQQEMEQGGIIRALQQQLEQDEIVRVMLNEAPALDSFRFDFNS